MVCAYGKAEVLNDSRALAESLNFPSAAMREAMMGVGKMYQRHFEYHGGEFPVGSILVLFLSFTIRVLLALL